MKNFLLEIVTPDRKVFSQEVTMVIVKGAGGDLGILADHVPLVTPLKIAPVQIRQGDAKDELAVHGGFIEVRKGVVSILAERAERAEDINLERALAAKERAENRIKNAKQQDIDFRRAEMALRRATTRIEVKENRNQH